MPKEMKAHAGSQYNIPAKILGPGCAGGHYIDEDDFLKRRLRGEV